MNRFTRQHDSERQHSIPGETRGEVDLPFPNKPVSHKIPLRTEIPLGLRDFEKISLLPQQKGIRETTKSLHSKKYSQNLPSGELQMNRAIQTKKLMLQEKIWKTEEKIRETMPRNVDTAAGFQPERGEEMENRGQAELEEIYSKTRISEYQRRESLKTRDVTADESLLEDLKKKEQDERNEDRFRNEVHHRIWEISGPKTEREPRLQNTNEPSRRKTGDEKDYGVRKEPDKRYRKQCEASPGTWSKEKKYKERTRVIINGSDEKPTRSQKSREKLTTGRTTENPSSTGRNLCKKLALPHAPSSLHTSREQQLTLIDTTGNSLHRLPCKFCNRKFQSDRLEMHVEVCGKLNQKKRQVFNSYAQRNKRLQLKE